jgi:hypothetical protein
MIIMEIDHASHASGRLRLPCGPPNAKDMSSHQAHSLKCVEGGVEVTTGVVILGVLIPLIRTRLPGQDRRSHEHRCRQQSQKQHQSSQLILLPKASPYHFLPVSQKPPFHKGGTVNLAADRRGSVQPLGCGLRKLLRERPQYSQVHPQTTPSSVARC